MVCSTLAMPWLFNAKYLGLLIFFKKIDPGHYCIRNRDYVVDVDNIFSLFSYTWDDGVIYRSV
jgi:hypothetical protein